MGLCGLHTQLQRARMVSTAPLDVCGADLGKADTLAPDGLSIRGKSWEGRIEERCSVWRQKAQPEWKARSGSSSVCRRSGRSRSVGSKGRLSCRKGGVRSPRAGEEAQPCLVPELGGLKRTTQVVLQEISQADWIGTLASRQIPAFRPQAILKKWYVCFSNIAYIVWKARQFYKAPSAGPFLSIPKSHYPEAATHRPHEL